MFKRRWKWFEKLLSDEGFTLAYGHNSITYSDARGSFQFGEDLTRGNSQLTLTGLRMGSGYHSNLPFVDTLRRIETCASTAEHSGGRYPERGDLWVETDYGRGRSSRTTSERSCTRSRTTSRPSGERSKSRISKSGERLVNCRWAPVSRSRSQRFLC
jgi:hypothetical protein